MKQEIESTFQVVKERSTRDELVFLCPECGDKSGNRSVNLKTGKTFCWRCNKGKANKGFFLAWARALGFQFSAGEGYSTVSVEQVFAQDSEEQSSAVPLVQETKLPKGFTPIAKEPKCAYTRLITRMAQQKNLGYRDFVEANVGFTRDDPRWEPFAIFPVYEFGFPVYYQGRTYVDVPGETTKRFPSRSMVRWGASYWVYNIDAVRKSPPEIVVIVESILNVLSLRWKLRELGWDSVVPVCVFKHHMSQVQTLKLIRCKGVKEFCMLFDHDAIEATWRNVEALDNRVAVTVAEMPMLEGNKKCDPNDDVDAAIEAIERRKLYTKASASRQFLMSNAGQVDITGRKIGSK